jgi:hypothetical protein
LLLATRRAVAETPPRVLTTPPPPELAPLTGARLEAARRAELGVEVGPLPPPPAPGLPRFTTLLPPTLLLSELPLLAVAAALAA